MNITRNRTTIGKKTEVDLKFYFLQLLQPFAAICGRMFCLNVQLSPSE